MSIRISKCTILAWVILTLSTVSTTFGQGWNELIGTTFVSGSVCVPNNFGVGSGYPAFAWADNCYNMIGNWNGAIADTKRNRLIMWGMGHVETPGNELYSLDLVTASPNAKGTSNGSSVPAIRRLNDPSNPRDYPNNSSTQYITQADGYPIARHTYGSMVYLPRSDRMIAWAGQEYDGNLAQSKNLWLLQLADDMSNPDWKSKQPTGIPSGIIWANGVLDTTSDDEAVFWIGGASGNHYMWHYDVTTDTLTTPVSYGGWTVGAVLAAEGVPVVDPDRKLIYFIGYGTNLGAGKFYSIMMESPYTSTDLSSTVVGCSALMAAKFPGLVYDPSINRIVGYPNTGNSIYIFDPMTMTCVVQTFSGGPTGSTQNNSNGMFGRFNYFPALGKYVVVNNHAANAYTLQLSKTPTHGLGASTVTCLDRDGDTYGPGCAAGPDADDQDKDVHTAAEALAKWTNMAGFLAHLGYSPTHIWYVAPTGNDATGAVDNVSAPFQTCCGAGKANPTAGDMIMMRGGTHDFLMYPPTGTVGHPVVIMAYPGELPVFSTNLKTIILDGKKYVTVDGIKCAGCDSSKGFLRLETNSSPYSMSDNGYFTVRHVESSGNMWGILGDTTHDVTIEDSVLHDNNGEHGIYIANHDGYQDGIADVSINPSSNIFIRRNIISGNGYTAIHLNGRFLNAIVEQNLMHNNVIDNGSAAISWQTGVSYSAIKNNVFLNSPTAIGIDSYAGWCATYSPLGATCPYGQHHNLIEGNSSYATGKFSNGNDFPAGFASVAINNTSGTSTNQGYQTFRNNILVNYHIPGSGYATFHFDAASATDAATSTFANNQLWNAYSTPGTAAFSINTTYYTCAQAVAGSGSTFGSVANCAFGDPKFQAASTTYYNSPTSFNLRLQSNSPALTGASTTRLPLFDLLGTQRTFAAPSLGAYQYVGAASTVLRPQGSVRTTGAVW